MGGEANLTEAFEDWEEASTVERERTEVAAWESVLVRVCVWEFRGEGELMRDQDWLSSPPSEELKLRSERREEVVVTELEGRGV